MCAVLSQANKHIEALKHAKLAILMCEDNIIKTNYLYIQMNKNNVNLDVKKNKISTLLENYIIQLFLLEVEVISIKRI